MLLNGKNRNVTVTCDGEKITDVKVENCEDVFFHIVADMDRSNLIENLHQCVDGNDHKIWIDNHPDNSEEYLYIAYGNKTFILIEEGIDALIECLHDDEYILYCVVMEFPL